MGGGAKESKSETTLEAERRNHWVTAKVEGHDGGGGAVCAGMNGSVLGGYLVVSVSEFVEAS